ncbi:MAG TPA: response regulator [Thermodesulfobacteriota bacterium]
MADPKILVVEDSPTMRQLIVFALKRLKGVTVVEANDGVDGLKKLSSDRFDLVMTDINMPVMDGLKLVSLIRNDATHKDTPIVVITTEGAQEDKDRALSLGANAFVTKPVQSANILKLAQELLKVEGA